MRITEAQLRRIIRQEVRALHEALEQDMRPTNIAKVVISAYDSGTGIDEVGEKFKSLIDDLVKEDNLFSKPGLTATVLGIMETQLREDVLAGDIADWFKNHRNQEYKKYADYL